ncbi:MAG: hypothetical protein J0I21_05860 [Alphaproteobacteria bacterium]|nr:hypothetical protein [Alphaproteobacteria bacterium]
MAPDYATMLRTAVQVQGALAATCCELAARWAQVSAHTAGRLAESLGTALRAGPDHRQRALEAVLHGSYVAHEESLRGMTGAGRLALLVLLNEIDRHRGPRAMMPDTADVAGGGD